MRITTDNLHIDDGLWEFNQHKTGAHVIGGGLSDADDTNAWDANWYTPGNSNADVGQDVRPVAEGDVVDYGGVSPPGGGSGAVLVAHPNKEQPAWWSGYLHMSEIQVRSGQHVTIETVLGKVDRVGVRPPNDHLHFAVYTGNNTRSGLKSFDVAIIPRPGAGPPPTGSTPVISSVSPRTTLPSTFDMTIIGTGFDGTAIDEVYLKSTGRLIGSGQILSRSNTQIVVRQSMAGAAATTYQVRVRNGNGALSNALDFTLTAPTASLAISSVTPTSVVPSTFDMTITGTGFDAGALDQVYLKSDGRLIGNGQILSRSSTQIIVRQSMAGATPTTYQVRVKNSSGDLSNPLDFTLTPPASTLAITSVSPTSAVPSTFDMTITGTGFDAGAIDQVYLKSDGRLIGNGQILTRSSTQIVVRQSMAGATPTTYQVRVRNSNGDLSNPLDFTLTAPATSLAISSVSPTSVVSGIFDMTITGTGFDNGAIDQVYLKSDGRFIGNGQILSRNSTRIVVRQSMAGATPTTYQVRVRNSSGDLSNALDFTLTQPPVNLTITSVSPTSVVPSTFDMTISGTGFDSGAIDQVHLKSDGRFIGNGQILSRSATQILVRQSMAGASPTTYQVRIRNSDGALSNAIDFTLTQPNPVIAAVSPTSVVASTFDMTISGTGFDSGAIDQVYLRSDGRFIGNGQILSRTSTQLVVRQSMSGATATTYQVRVRNSNGALSNAVDFTIR